MEIRQKDRHVALGAGSFYGYMALIEGRRCQVSVNMLTSCRLPEHHAGDFHRLTAADPPS